MTQLNSLEDALTKICHENDLTTCSINCGVDRDEAYAFSTTVHWEGFSNDGISCHSEHGISINSALQKTLLGAQKDREQLPIVDELPSLEVVR